MLNQFYRVTFRKKVYRTIEELRADLDSRRADDNQNRIPQSRYYYGKPPMQKFLDSVELAKKKI